MPDIPPFTEATLCSNGHQRQQWVYRVLLLIGGITIILVVAVKSHEGTRSAAMRWVPQMKMGPRRAVPLTWPHKRRPNTDPTHWHNAAVVVTGAVGLLVVLRYQMTAKAPAVRWSLGDVLRSRRNSRRGVKVLQLHDDVWLHISDFCQSRHLSLVCSNLWHVLHGRHLTCNFFDSHSLLKMAQRFQTDIRLATLTVDCHYLGATGAHALAMMQRYSVHRSSDSIHNLTVRLRSIRHRSTGDASALAIGLLRNAPSLRSLTVNLWGNDVGDDGVRTMAVLAKSLSLQSLALNLWCNNIGNIGAQALATFKDCTQLHRLCLGLACNHVGLEGAQALALLRHSSSLRSLTLVLSVNQLGDSGAHVLARLRDLQHLHTLSLDLGDNSLGDSGASAIATLGTIPTLRTLNLSLWRNYIGDSGAVALANLRFAPALEDLTLNLRMNRIREDGAHGLALLRLCHTLRRLSIDLGGNPIGDNGVMCLSKLAEAELTSLELSFSCTGIGDPGATALSAFRNAPSLSSLTLNLSENDISDEGMKALVHLKESCTIRNLTLDVANNPISRLGVLGIQELLSAPLLQAVVVSATTTPVKRRGLTMLQRALLVRPYLLEKWNQITNRLISRYQSYPEYILTTYGHR